MNIRHLVDSSGFGGIESHLALLLPALVSHGHETDLCFLQHHGPHPLVDRLRKEQVAVEILDGRLTTLVRSLRVRPADILHTHGYKAGILGRIAGLLAKTPVVSTFHNGDLGGGRVALYTTLDRLTSLFSRNIAVSSGIGNMLLRSTVIPNFVDCPARPPASKEVRRIAFVGRLTPVKGPDRFLELARTTGAPATIYGDGEMRADLEASAPANVAFAGQVASMQPHWCKTGLLVITSRAEGLPLAALEAMAAGVPVAALGHGALPEVIDHARNGFIAGIDDLSSLSDFVRQWLDMAVDERMGMSVAAHATVASRYAAFRIVPQIESVYAQAARRAGCNMQHSPEAILVTRQKSQLNQ